MFRLTTFNLVAFLAVAGSASATTLMYHGENYHDVSYSATPGGGPNGPYDTSMSIKLMVDIDGALEADTRYGNFGDPGTKDLTVTYATDGIFEADTFWGEFETNAVGEIVTWYFEYYFATQAPDIARAVSSSVTGDSASHHLEFGIFEPTPAPFAISFASQTAESEFVCCGSETATATANNGTWSVQETLTPVPVPAAGGLYAFGLFFAGRYMRKRRAKT